MILSLIISIFSSPLLSDDPYYCGLRARVPNFVKASKPPSRIVDKNNNNYISNSNMNKILKEKEHSKKLSAAPPMMHGNGRDLYHHHQQQQQLPSSHHQSHYNMWHAKSYESGIGKIK